MKTLNKLGVFAIAVSLFVIVCVAGLRAQSPNTDWEKASGGKMAFSIASVKPDSADMSQQTVHANVSMGPGDYYNPTGGLFSATDFPLFTYIAFAYKLTTNDGKALSDQLPKWATTDRYDIEVRADGEPTKDQMRLMMQSLLADRFKLAIHYEAKQTPVFAMVLDKPGKTGPQLSMHPKDAACSTVYGGATAPGSFAGPDTLANGLPATCGGIQRLQPRAPGRIRFGARNVSLLLLANTLTGMGNLDRPVVDQTGLSGTVDFTIEYTPEVPTGADFKPDESGPTFLEALKDQLGLKLDSKTGTVDVIVLDHMEQLTPN